MFTRILNDDESKRFSDITGIRATKVFISKNNKYYYATIVVNSYIGDDGRSVPKHSFVVIDDSEDEISGLKYDFVANVMSSFQNEEHKHRKLRYG